MYACYCARLQCILFLRSKEGRTGPKADTCSVVCCGPRAELWDSVKVSFLEVVPE